MALTADWLNASVNPVPYASALKQGTGINPIHAQYGGEGRNTAPDGTVQAPDPTLIDIQQYQPPEPDFAPYQTWGYGHETGLADRPPFESNEAEARAATMQGYPTWGDHKGPGGNRIRAILKGATLGLRSRVQPNEDVAQGWRNKENSYVEDAVTSDPSQYIMQTSMVQRDAVRAGSQSSGTSSEYNAPIASRIPGMRARFWSGGERHADMEPKSQDQIIRPFYPRTAGTGYSDWMQVNDMYVSEPIDRTAPDNPYQGETVGDTDQSNFGYTDEDLSTW